MIHDPQLSLTEIGRVIAKDPGLSLRLLRLVNSPFYGFQSKIDTISRAITVVGIDELYNLVVATCVVDHFDHIPSELVDMTAFWLNSVHTGVVAKLLAKQNTELHSERLFLAGLLHDIGSLVLYQKMPDKCLKVLHAAGHDRRLIPEFEREIFGFTHADVGCELIKSWGLPESLSEPIGCCLDPETAKHYSVDSYLLHIAARLVAASECGIPPERSSDDLSPQALTITHLNRVQLINIMEQAAAEFLTVFNLMSPNKKLH